MEEGDVLTALKACSPYQRAVSIDESSFIEDSFR